MTEETITCEICEEEINYCDCLRCMNCGQLFSADDAEEELVYDEEHNYEGTCKECVADPSRTTA